MGDRLELTVPRTHPWWEPLHRALAPCLEGRRVWGNPETEVRLAFGDDVRVWTVCGYNACPRWKGDDDPPWRFFLAEVLRG